MSLFDFLLSYESNGVLFNGFINFSFFEPSIKLACFTTIIFSLCLCQQLVDAIGDGSKIRNRERAEQHLVKGTQFLSKGQFSDALQHYHSAVEADSEYYQSYYRRATVFLATGKVHSAMLDLDRVVELKSDFIQGRIQRANVLLKHGRLDEANVDLIYVRNQDPDNSEANEHLQRIIQIQRWLDDADYHSNIGNWQKAEVLIEKAIEYCQWDAKLHRMRSKCRLSRGDVVSAISDIRAVAQLVPDSTDAYLEASQMYYEIGDLENALGNVRDCLRLDQDHPQCFTFYKRIRKVSKLREAAEKALKEKRWVECIAKVRSFIESEPANKYLHLDSIRISCQCNAKLGHINEAIEECSRVLTELNENDLEILLERGEAYIQLEDYDKAMEDFQKALNAHSSSQDAQEGLKRAQKLKSLAGKKDYYKILGVRRNANEDEISQAYRKLARKWHPDRFKDEKEKKKAQEKFIDIANAKEVLTDPEKRRMYDAGVDPMSPEGQAGGGQWAHQAHHWQQHFSQAFGQGFNPFGGGSGEGYTFKFNFG